MSAHDSCILSKKNLWKYLGFCHWKCFNVLPIVKVFPTTLSDSSQASLSILMKLSPQYLVQWITKNILGLEWVWENKFGSGIWCQIKFQLRVGSGTSPRKTTRKHLHNWRSEMFPLQQPDFPWQQNFSAIFIICWAIRANRVLYSTYWYCSPPRWLYITCLV